MSALCHKRTFGTYSTVANSTLLLASIARLMQACNSFNLMPVGIGLPANGRGPSWALQQDEAALRAPAGRYPQRGRAGGQSLRRDDVAGSRTDDELGQGHLRNQQPRHSYAGD